MPRTFFVALNIIFFTKPSRNFIKSPENAASPKSSPDTPNTVLSLFIISKDSPLLPIVLRLNNKSKVFSGVISLSFKILFKVRSEKLLPL